MPFNVDVFYLFWSKQNYLIFEYFCHLIGPEDQVPETLTIFFLKKLISLFWCSIMQFNFSSIIIVEAAYCDHFWPDQWLHLPNDNNKRWFLFSNL